jgi:hypothetical protein
VKLKENESASGGWCARGIMGGRCGTRHLPRPCGTGTVSLSQSTGEKNGVGREAASTERSKPSGDSLDKTAKAGIFKSDKFD